MWGLGSKHVILHTPNFYGISPAWKSSRHKERHSTAIGIALRLIVTLFGSSTASSLFVDLVQSPHPFRHTTVALFLHLPCSTASDHDIDLSSGSLRFCNLFFASLHVVSRTLCYDGRVILDVGQSCASIINREDKRTGQSLPTYRP